MLLLLRPETNTLHGYLLSYDAKLPRTIIYGIENEIENVRSDNIPVMKQD